MFAAYRSADQGGKRMLDRPQGATAPQAPTLDQAALAHALSGLHLIGGRLVPALSGKTFPVVNPATGAQVAQAAEGDGADVDAAVRDAAAAQKTWAKSRPASAAPSSRNAPR
jgi:delta 1-pyrroline-5-carboxylate dehydrogenase